MAAYVLEPKDQEIAELQTESSNVLRAIQEEEGRSEDQESETGAALEMDQGTGEGKILVEQDVQAQLEEENSAAKDREGQAGEQGAKAGDKQAGASQAEASEETEDNRENMDPETSFQKRDQKKQGYEWDYYESYESLVKEFYAIDNSTSIDRTQLNLEALLGKDMRLSAGADEPQILIYHTHSQEAFADSVPGDESTTILGAGERLAQILREEYGFNVLHHTGKYDVESRDFAYTNSLPALEQVLAENPSIEVVIDLHRDAMAEETHLVMDVDGRPTARFMFFNGLSRTKKTGDIDSLPNPYIADNLAFAFQMQVLCNEYYPGITRRIYLKGYRYNMHLRPKSMLIELGAQNNTVEEVMNACDILAQMLAKLLNEGVDG